MEIWPDDESWYDESDGSSGSDGEQQQRRPPGPPRGTRPLLTVTVVRSQIPNNDIIVSAPPLSVSPTATLAFRRTAFAWLFPAWFLGARLVAACGGGGGGGGGVCWMAVAVVVLAVGAVGLVVRRQRRRALVERSEKAGVRRSSGCRRWDWCASGRRRVGGRARSKNQSVDLLESGDGAWLGKERRG